MGGLPNLITTASAFTRVDGYESAQELLDSSALPTAIFAASDVLAVGAMQAIKERGLGRDCVPAYAALILPRSLSQYIAHD